MPQPTSDSRQSSSSGTPSAALQAPAQEAPAEEVPAQEAPAEEVPAGPAVKPVEGSLLATVAAGAHHDPHGVLGAHPAR